MQVLSSDRVSSYMFDDSLYVREEKDGRVVFKLMPEHYGFRNRPLLISLDLISDKKMMYRVFVGDFVDCEEILGII